MTDDVLMNAEGEQRRVDEAREWLSRIRRLTAYQRTLEESAKARMARADGLKALDYERPQVRSSPYADAIPDAVAANEELGAILQSISESARADIAEAAEAIARLGDPLEAGCLHLYYIDAVKTWDRVAELVGYSTPWVEAVRRRALLHVYDEMPYRERSPMPPAL